MVDTIHSIAEATQREMGRHLTVTETKRTKAIPGLIRTERRVRQEVNISAIDMNMG